MTAPTLAWSYPAIAACICEARRPNRAEVRVVAARIWRDVFGPHARASFGMRRRLLRATMAALAGADAGRGRKGG